MAVPPEVEALARQLFDLARSGDTVSLEACVAAGIPADLRDEGGNTLLMLAAYHGHDRTVLMLAARGADVDRRNDDGRTPLAGAVFREHRAVVSALIELGADPTLGTPSAIGTARIFGQVGLLAELAGTAPTPA